MPSEQANQTRQPTENLQEGRTATKNIVLMSDGTGNSAAKVWRTNVWRLFESLDLTNSSQVAIYDDGVGSSSFKLLAALGGAVGWGLKRNVLDLYAFLCRNYGPNARIYAFGFSRGAFTIRVLLGLVNNQGLVPVNSEAQLRRDAKAAYRAYRRERYRSNLNLLVAPLRALRDAAIEVWHRSLGRTTYRQRLDVLKPRVHFVGLWDTVAAYGLPIEEMTRGVSLWIWPLSLPDRHLSDNVDRACHALSLDDARTTFHPVLWSEKGHKPPPPRADGYCYIEDERLTQVWFAGVHANVGGGYPDDSLSRVSLYWMMREAQARGLRLKADPPADPDALRWARSASDKDGRLYDSRHGVAGYYRYGPRKIHDLSHMRFSSTEDDEVTIDVPKIHCSAIERIINGAHAYAPIGFPDRYAVVDPDGKILNLDDPKNAHETPAQATARKDVQERVWNLVWGRRVTYFATLAATLYLVFFPLIHDAQQAGETSSRFHLLAPIIRTVALILPSFTNWWIEAYVASPGWFALGAIAVAALMLFGADLERSITDRMRIIWGTILKQKRVPAGQLPNDFVYRLRTHRIYQWVVWAMKRYILPTLFAALLVYVALAGVSRVLFAIGDSFGLVCRGSDPAPLTAAIVKPFDPSLLCWASGAGLEARRRYRLTLTLDPNVPWRDGSIDTDLGGFSREKMSSAMYWGLPWRRTLSEPWFKPIARIGSTGGDEYPLTSARPVSRDDLKRQLVAEFQTRTKGELFLYVNDAVIGLPGLADTFYVGERGRNFGRAEIKVERID